MVDDVGDDEHPRGPRWRGCLERFACSGGQARLRSEHSMRMSRARREFQHPKGEPPRGIARLPFARK
eukprot:1396942-Pyramimonas_sp.AAC.1